MANYVLSKWLTMSYPISVFVFLYLNRNWFMFGWARRERAQTHNAKLNYIVLPASQQRGIPCCYRTWHTIPQWRNRQWSWHLAKVAHLYPWNTRCMLKGWNGKVITSTFFTLFRRISLKSLVLVVFWNESIYWSLLWIWIVSGRSQGERMRSTSTEFPERQRTEIRLSPV